MLKLRKTKKGAIIRAKVAACSDEFAVAGFDRWSSAFKIKVKSPAEKGKANLEIERKLGEITGCRAEIIKGRHSREKTIELQGNTEKAAEALEKALAEN